MLCNGVRVDTECTDATLVAASLGGDHGAFRQIVERYQTLVCSIAYSATGNVSRSEDVAQETFIAAWSQLASLREPDKLRGWLCGIVRNRLHRDRREDSHEVVRGAVELADAPDVAALEPPPSEQAVTREEEAILWRSLQHIPPLYREPLVLFYREHCSVAEVAAKLELSEEAVKQRLSRGRKLLQDSVQAMVENTLRRTAPGETFSTAVVAMLPAVATSGAATSLGAKSALAAKSGLAAGWLVTLFPFLGIAAGVWAHWLLIREATGTAAARRRQIALVIFAWLAYLGCAIGGERLVLWGLNTADATDRTHFAALALFWWTLLAGTLTVQVTWMRRANRRREAPTQIARPMSRATLAVVSAGTYLALFSWLIALCWREGDRVGLWATTGTMVVLGVIAYAWSLGRTGAALGRVAGAQIGLACGVILLLLNLRLGSWMAADRGISVAEVARILPLWMVPVLTLALVAWVGLLFAVFRPWRGSAEG